jgi:PHD/YefM family antitoxin component YafN of YafNO toxin-antitoxin module
MAERMKSITDARQGLPGLSQTAGERMERYIITQKGQPQSVLLGYKDYQGMVAAVELLHQPAALANLHRGLQQLRKGSGTTFEEMEAAVERAEANDSTDVLNAFQLAGDYLQGEGVALAAAAESTWEPVRPEPISKTIEIPEFGNIEVILTRTVGGGNKVPNVNRARTSTKESEQHSASKTTTRAAKRTAGSAILKAKG